MKHSKDANKVDDRGTPIERERRPAGYRPDGLGTSAKPRGHLSSVIFGISICSRAPQSNRQMWIGITAVGSKRNTPRREN
ncbi:hypothetical protein FQA39_LY09926 [Lamprigera yunnana]|nr:hypothetical protein FQA39_LY09926 [Lamprigera yunnana]